MAEKVPEDSTMFIGRSQEDKPVISSDVQAKNVPAITNEADLSEEAVSYALRLFPGNPGAVHIIALCELREIAARGYDRAERKKA